MNAINRVCLEFLFWKFPWVRGGGGYIWTRRVRFLNQTFKWESPSSHAYENKYDKSSLPKDCDLKIGRGQDIRMCKWRFWNRISNWDPPLFCLGINTISRVYLEFVILKLAEDGIFGCADYDSEIRFRIVTPLFCLGINTISRVCLEFVIWKLAGGELFGYAEYDSEIEYLNESPLPSEWK